MAVALTTTAAAQEEPPFDRYSRTRGLVGGWSHSWRPVFVWGETSTDIAFVAFHPRMGWFVSNRLELFGEATVLVYYQPKADITLGLAGLAGRYHLRRRGRVIPYATLGGGLAWTSLDVPEINRVYNFQVFFGGGIRLLRARNPGIVIELRNHHISNAGTAPPNFGIDAAQILIGVEWILR